MEVILGMEERKKKMYEVKFYDSRRVLFCTKLCEDQDAADRVFLRLAPKLKRLGGAATIERKLYAKEKAIA